MPTTIYDLRMFFEVKKRIEMELAIREKAKIVVKKFIMPLSLQKTLSKGVSKALSTWEGIPVETGEVFTIVS